MNAIARIPVLLAFAAAVSAQQGGGLRGPATASAGSTIVVEVATNDDTVAVHVSGSGDSSWHEVPPDKRVLVTVPPAPPGAVLIVRIGRGSRSHRIVVEIVAP